jgi:hypothetical protein
MNCYVYVYLDPRKPGKYEYNGILFDYEPFYIGYGSGNRINDHKYSLNKPNPTGKLFLIKLNEIYQRIGELPPRFKVEENLSRDTAKQREIFWIATIGREDLGEGPLANHTRGSDGVVGSVPERNSMYGKGYKVEGKNHWTYKLKEEGGIHPLIGKPGPWKDKVVPRELVERRTKHMKGDSNPQCRRKKLGLPTTAEMHHKGKTYEERFGVEKAKEIKEKLKKAQQQRRKREKHKLN